MKTTEGVRPRPAALLPVLLLLLAWVAPPVAAAVPGPRLSLGVAAGVLYPTGAPLRRLYGHSLLPVELQVGWELGEKLTLWGGARYYRAAGGTALTDPVRPGETYPLRLDVLAARLGLNWWLGSGRVAPFLGAGVLCTFFRERWLDLPIEARGQRAGFFAQAGGRWRLGRSLSVLLQLDYSRMPSGLASDLADDVELGGLGLALGLRAGIL